NYYLVSELIDYGLEGIEVKHPAHNLLLENKARDLALMHDLIMTGGSDFHGFYDRYPKKLGYYSPSIDIIYKLKEKSSDIR
ncbi:MAG: phosphatase, partial [bacterium]